jgi:hypothetical protein
VAKKGLITIAFGKPKYLRQAVCLARSLRYHMPDWPVSLVTDQLVFDGSDMFDQIIPLNQKLGRGVTQKLGLYESSPYEETLFIDSDCICVRDFSAEFAQIRQRDFASVGGEYLKAGDREKTIKDLAKTLAELGISRFLKFNGGVYFFRKSGLAEAVFGTALSLLERYQDLGIRQFDSAGANDETLFGLAMELHQIELFRDKSRMMRTPWGVTSRIEIDPLGAGCHFLKNGRRVEPALIHFCGPHGSGPEYKFCQRVFQGPELVSKTEYNRLLRSLRRYQTWVSLPRQKIIANKTLKASYFKLREVMLSGQS